MTGKTRKYFADSLADWEICGFDLRVMNTIEYRTLRKTIGTQSEVADLLGISERTLQGMESGAREITPEDAAALNALVVTEQVTLPVTKRNLDATPKRTDLDPLTANILHWYVDPGYVLS